MPLHYAARTQHIPPERALPRPTKFTLHYSLYVLEKGKLMHLFFHLKLYNMQEENGMKFKLGGNHRSFPDGNAKKRQTETISKSPPAVSLVTFGVSRGEPAGRNPRATAAHVEVLFAW